MANNIAILDATSTSNTVKTTDTAGVHTPHHNVDSSALPTGASTLAEQQTQTTSLQLLDDVVLAEDAAHSSGDKGIQLLSVRSDTASARGGTDGDYQPLLTDASGRLHVNLSSTTKGTAGSPSSEVITVQGVASMTAIKVDNSAVTQPISGTVTANAGSGTFTIAGAVTNAGTFAVQPSPATSNGLTISRDIDLDNGTLTVVKASAGQVYGWTICNTTTATVYVKFYDATSGTLGTGTPVLTIGIPGNATDDTTLAQSFGGMGITFATGISVGAGTGVADADNTDPGANGVVANIYYK